MQRLPRLAILIGVLSLPPISGAANQLQHELTDVGKVFEGFPAALALSDIDEDGDLDCVTATREDYDASVPSATYMWLLKSVNGHEARNISFYFRAGDAPGQVLLKDKNVDGPLQNGAFVYSDYKNCVVVEMPYQNSQECMLWITWEAKDKVPQRCTDEYEDTCDGVKKTFDDATCSPFLEVNGS